jgi:hypothetical protein
MKNEMSCSYVISKFKYHKELKEELLGLLDTADYQNVVHKDAEVNISKTDWHLSKDPSRPWTMKFQEFLVEHMKEVYQEMGYDDFVLEQLWFQQYQQSSEHGWHVHGCTFTSVYYLELPEGTPKTEWVNPFNQTDISKFDVQEGDVLTFPSFVVHRAPPNTSELRKTIISYNTSTCYPDSQYGRNLSY